MFDTNPKLLSNLINAVATGDTQLPDFQRGWVWDDHRIKGLLASISRGFPIGAVMTLEAGGNIQLKARLMEGVELGSVPSPSAYLLDGQQRLTSLYQALRHPDAVDTTDSRNRRFKRWYYIDMAKAVDERLDREDAIISIPENKIVTEDFGRREVLNLSTAEQEFENHMMPTESVMNPTSWLLGYVSYWSQQGKVFPNGSSAPEFFQEFKTTVLDNFAGYQLPVIELGKETPKEAVCTVFEKVNTGGVSLTVFELVTATFAVDDSFSLRDDWAERSHKMYSEYSALRGVSGEQFLQAVALLKTQEDNREDVRDNLPRNRTRAVGCTRRDILNLELKNYRDWADKVQQGFIETAKFLRSQFVFGNYNIPYGTQLVPLAALFVELGSDINTALAKDRLERWYWSGVFGELYGGAVESQFARDLVEVAAFVRAGIVPNSINEANFIPQRLISLRTRNSAAYKGVYALQLKYGARDWMSGEQLSFATYDNAHIDIHHIFPVAWSRNNDVPRALYDSVINKTPVDAHTNRVMGGQAPSGYLRRLEPHVPEGSLDDLLHSHWIGRDHLDRDNFGEFFIVRGQHMLELIGQAMGRDLGDGREVFEQALTDAGVLDEFADEGPEYDEVGESEREETEAA